MPFLRERSPDGTTTTTEVADIQLQLTTHLSTRKDETLSWPIWLACSGWFAHISDHPSATGRAQDSESTPAKDRCYTVGPRNQPLCALSEDRETFSIVLVNTVKQQLVSIKLEHRRIERQPVTERTNLKPNSITLPSSELAPNMFGASSELVRS